MHFCACIDCNLLNIYRGEQENCKEKGKTFYFQYTFLMGHVVAQLFEALRYKPVKVAYSIPNSVNGIFH